MSDLVREAGEQAEAEEIAIKGDRKEATCENGGEVIAQPAAAVPEPAPIIGGLTSLMFGGRSRVAEDLGPSMREITGAPGEHAPDYSGWVGAPKIADALMNLAFGRIAAEDCAVRLITGSIDSPIARRVLPECAELALRGVRFSLILSEEPKDAEALTPIAAISRSLGLPRLDDFMRIADFPGAEICLEQAMIGDRFYWTGEPLARRRPTPLQAGTVIDLSCSNAAPDAARLRFAAAWRLAGEPSHEFCRRVAAVARAL